MSAKSSKKINVTIQHVNNFQLPPAKSGGMEINLKMALAKN
ncbi:hypothetical protein [Flavobacterium magnesitis]